MRSLMARVELEVTGPQYRGRARGAEMVRRAGSATVTLRSSGVDDEPPRAPGGIRDEHVPPPAAVPAARAREVPAQHLGHLTRELPREHRRSRRAAAHEQWPLPLDHGPRPDGPHAPLRELEV